MIKLIYLILAHENPHQVLRLVKSLQSKNSFFYVHIDKKASIRPFQNLFTKEQFESVCFIKNRIKCKWGHISIIKATTLLLTEIHKEYHKNAYVILLSGSHYPIKSIAYIHEFLAKNYGKIFMESIPLSHESWKFGGLARIKNYYFFPTSNKQHITSVPFLKNFNDVFKLPGRRRKIFGLIRYLRVSKIRSHPTDIIPMIGSQWWSLPVETSKMVLEIVRERPDLLKFHQFSFAPDEMYFQSILTLLPVKTSERIVQNNLVFMDWEKHKFREPAIIDDSYISELKLSEKLFARKFEYKNDDLVYDLIDLHCRQNNSGE